MTFPFLNKLLFVAGACALLQGAAGCSASPAAPFSADFLAHLRANAPAAIRECIVAKTRARWPDEQALLAQAKRQRAVRGQTDVVNFAIAQTAANCSPP